MLILYDIGIYTVRLRDQYSELLMYPKTRGATSAVSMLLNSDLHNTVGFLHLWKGLLSLKSLSDVGARVFPMAALVPVRTDF